MEQYLTFDQLPTAVTKLTKEVSELKALIKENQAIQQPEQQPEQPLTIKQAAEFLNLTVPTIYSKVSKRELPYMKRGGRLYFSNCELMEYLKQGRAKTESELQAEAAKRIHQRQ